MSVPDAGTWVLAIDFGTSFTVAAVRSEGRAAEVIEIGGERRIPSIVLAEESGLLVVGVAAEHLASSQPGRTLRSPKTRIGEPAPVVLGGQAHSVVDLVAAILRHVYDEAVRHEGSPPREVRLTHPASWNRPRLVQFLEATQRAGLPSPSLVAEPVAAAVAYAEQSGDATDGYVAVYDLGGGTFDTAVLESSSEGFSLVGRPGGDANIGGELFDELLVAHVGQRLDPAAWEALQASDDEMWRRAAASLRTEARRVKEALSSHPYSELLVGLPSGLVKERVTRDELEALIQPYVEESVDVLAQCIDDTGIPPEELAAVYIVGGASRSPIVERTVTDAFPGVHVSRWGDPKAVVAVGATSRQARPSTVGRGGSTGEAAPPPAPVVTTIDTDAPTPSETGVDPSHPVDAPTVGSIAGATALESAAGATALESVAGATVFEGANGSSIGATAVGAGTVAGASAAGATVAGAGGSANEPPVYQSTPPNRWPPRKPVALAIAAVVLLLALVGGVLALTGGDDSPDVEVAGTTTIANPPVSSTTTTTTTTTAPPPQLTLASHTTGQTVTEPNVTLRGQTAVGAQVALNGNAAIVGADGVWAIAVVLSPGANDFVVQSTLNGSTSTVMGSLTYQPPPETTAPRRETPTQTPQQPPAQNPPPVDPTTTTPPPPPNQIPIANDDPSICIDSSSAAWDLFVFANDTDPDGNGYYFNRFERGPYHGTAQRVTVGDRHAIRYTPNASFDGYDEIYYTLIDDAGGVSRVAFVGVYGNGINGYYNC